MEALAVSVFPIANLEEWQVFIDSVVSGDRAEPHRQFLRRLGVKREHVRRQSSPTGDVMVLIWEGVDQDHLGEIMGDMLQNPQTDHERYIVEHVIPQIHGVDPSAGPPPMIEKVATIET